MKLRLHTNSLRLRLTRPEVECLHATGMVEESLAFSDGATLSYRLQTRLKSVPPEAVTRNGSVTVYLSQEDTERWASSEEVGVYAQDGQLAIAIEKDFRCLTPRAGEADAGAYPNPAKS